MRHNRQTASLLSVSRLDHVRRYTLFAVNLDALYFTCFYIPEKGCAEFLDLTRPFFIPGCLGPSAALALEPRRAVARVLFEIFAEEGLGRKIQFGSYFLDT